MKTFKFLLSIFIFLSCYYSFGQQKNKIKLEVVGYYKGQNVYGAYQFNYGKKSYKFFLTPTGHSKYKYLYQENNKPFPKYAKLYSSLVLYTLNLNDVKGYLPITKKIEFTASPKNKKIISLISINNNELFSEFKKAKIILPYEMDKIKKENDKLASKNKFKFPYKDQVNKAWDGYYASQTKKCLVCNGTGKTYIAQRQTDTYTSFTKDDANTYKKTTTSTGNHYRRVRCSTCKGTGKVKKHKKRN